MNNNQNKKTETRGRKKKDPSKKMEYQITTRLTKKEYFAWKIYLKNNNTIESEALRTFALEKIKEISFEDMIDIASTMEISLKPKNIK